MSQLLLYIQQCIQYGVRSRGSHRRDYVHKHLLKSTKTTEHHVEDSFLQYLFNFSSIINSQYYDSNICLASYNKTN